MVRILVTPEKLYSLSHQISRSAAELDEIENWLGRALGTLDWDVRHQINIEHQVQAARHQARQLSEQAEGLARFLSERAREFQQADSQGVDTLGSLQEYYRGLSENFNRDKINEILGKLKNAVALGEFLAPLGAASVIGLSMRGGSTYPGQVIINLPDGLRKFKGLRKIRELAGLSGHLNHFSYTNLPSKMLGWGTLLSVPIIASKWMTDITEYRGMQLVSALVIDTALTLAPVAASFVVSQAVTWGAAALGTYIFPGAGTAAGYAAGAAAASLISGTVANLATQWAIDPYNVRDQAIQHVDNVLQTVAQSVQHGYQQVILSD